MFDGIFSVLTTWQIYNAISLIFCHQDDAHYYYWSKVTRVTGTGTHKHTRARVYYSCVYNFIDFFINHVCRIRLWAKKAPLLSTLALSIGYKSKYLLEVFFYKVYQIRMRINNTGVVYFFLALCFLFVSYRHENGRTIVAFTNGHRGIFPSTEQFHWIGIAQQYHYLHIIVLTFWPCWTIQMEMHSFGRIFCHKSEHWPLKNR